MLLSGPEELPKLAGKSESMLQMGHLRPSPRDITHGVEGGEMALHHEIAKRQKVMFTLTQPLTIQSDPTLDSTYNASKKYVSGEPQKKREEVFTTGTSGKYPNINSLLALIKEDARISSPDWLHIMINCVLKGANVYENPQDYIWYVRVCGKTYLENMSLDGDKAIENAIDESSDTLADTLVRNPDLSRDLQHLIWKYWWEGQELGAGLKLVQGKDFMIPMTDMDIEEFPQCRKKDMKIIEMPSDVDITTQLTACYAEFIETSSRGNVSED